MSFTVQKWDNNTAEIAYKLYAFDTDFIIEKEVLTGTSTESTYYNSNVSRETIAAAWTARASKTYDYELKESLVDNRFNRNFLAFEDADNCSLIDAARKGVDIKVEDFPLLWIEGNGGSGYYGSYTGNVFQIIGNGCVYGGGVSDYAAMMSIDFENQSLTTNFTDVMLSKFVSLTELVCTSNSISVLDVTNITSLTNLSCSINSISILNVSNLTSLISLSCSNNSISVLNVTNLTSLTLLACVNNSISVLNVTNLTSLTLLACDENSISILDVSNLTSLISLSCHSNSISTLDVSNLTSLISLSCYTNSISTLDVSNLTSLTSLACVRNSISTLDVSNLTSLTFLNCANNSINVLNVTNLTSLTFLACSTNSISILNVTNLTSLTLLICNSNSISTLDVSNLTSLISLSCHSNQISNTTNSQILVDLDNNGKNNGYFRSSIFGDGSLTTAGAAAKTNLQGKGWTIVGL